MGTEKTGRRSTVAVGAALLLPLLLAACASAPGVAAPTGGTAASAASSEAPTSAAPVATLPEGLLGSGELHSADGETTGRVEISRTGDDLHFRVLDLTTPYSTVGFSVSFEPRGDDPCLDSGGLELTGDVASSGPVEATIPLAMVAHGDPTAIDDADLHAASRTPDDTCVVRSIARAAIHWDVAPLRPVLASLADSGARTGAHGTVEERSDGQRIYTVAADDTLDAVAARFGITPDDVFYLNESRRPSPQDPLLYRDEELNLSLAFR